MPTLGKLLDPLGYITERLIATRGMTPGDESTITRSPVGVGIGVGSGRDSPAGAFQPANAASSLTFNSFTVPATGGTQVLSGSVVDGGDGFTTSGTLTVVPVG